MTDSEDFEYDPPMTATDLWHFFWSVVAGWLVVLLLVGALRFLAGVL